MCVVLFVCCLESLSFWSCQMSGSKSMHEIHCLPSNKRKGYQLYGVDMDLSQSYQHSWWSLTQLRRARGPLYKAKLVCVVCCVFVSVWWAVCGCVFVSVWWWAVCGCVFVSVSVRVIRADKCYTNADKTLYERSAIEGHHKFLSFSFLLCLLATWRPHESFRRDGS